MMTPEGTGDNQRRQVGAELMGAARHLFPASGMGGRRDDTNDNYDNADNYKDTNGDQCAAAACEQSRRLSSPRAAHE